MSAPPGPAPPAAATPARRGREGREWPALLLLAVLALVAVRPLLSPRLLAGHDTRAYPARIVEFAENLRHGVLLPRWAPDLGGGHGLPLFLSSPPLFLAAGSALTALGAGVIRAQNLALLAFYLALGAAMWAAGRRLGGTWGGLVAATAYLYAPYVHLDVYVRGAAGEVSGLGVFPMALLAAERLAAGAGRAAGVLFAAALAWAGLAHNGILLLAAPLALALALVAHAARPPGARDRRALAQALAGIALGGLLPAYYLVPSLLEKEYLRIDRLAAGYFDYRHHFVYPTQLLSVKWGHGFSLPGKDDGMGFGLGPAHALLALAGLVAAWRRGDARGTRGDRRDRVLATALAVTAAAGIGLALAPAEPVWRALPLIQPLSFPFRFLVLPAFAFSALSAFAVRDRPRLALAACAALVALNLAHARPSGSLPDSDADYAPRAIAERNWEVGWGFEFLPRWVAEQPGYTIEPADLDGQAREVERTPERHRYTMTAARDGRVALRLFYFPGWEVTVDGREVAIRPEPVSGRIQFDLPRGSHAVAARLRRTPARLAGELISLAAALAALAALAAATVAAVHARRR